MKRVTLHRVAHLATWSTLALIAFGGYTRGSGSGYGCKDRWPLCDGGAFGGYLPKLDPQMIVEWTHRWIALLVGLLAVVIVIGAVRGKHRRSWIIGPAVAALVVIGIQAWLGRMVVKGGLDRDLITVHLVVSMVIVALFVVITVATRAKPVDGPGPVGWSMLIGVSAASVFSVMILGSIVHNMYFPGWPLVDGVLIPDLSDTYVAIHFLHRAATAVTFVLLVALVWQVRRHRRPLVEMYLVDGALSAFLVNGALGALHVFTQVQSSFVVAAHIGVAGLVWAALAGAAVASLGPLGVGRPSVVRPVPADGDRLLRADVDGPGE